MLPADIEILSSGVRGDEVMATVAERHIEDKSTQLGVCVEGLRHVLHFYFSQVLP